MQSKFVLRVLRPEPGARLSLSPSSPSPLRHLYASPSAARTKAADAFASQAELVGLARKVVRTGGRQPSAREPAPQHPPGETSEPQRRERKKQPRGRIIKLERYRAPDPERPGYTDFSRWLYLEPRELTCKTPCMPLLGFWQAPVACTPVGGMPRRAPGQAGQLRGGSAGGAASTPGVGLPQRGAQTSLPRTTRCGSLESYFKRISLRQRTHGTYSMSERPNLQGKLRSSPTLGEEKGTGGGTRK